MLVFVPMVDIFNMSCDCQFVFSVLDMFHITLNALRNILRERYKSIKCDVSCSQGNVSTLFRRGEHVIRVCVLCNNVLPAYSSAKIIFLN